MWLEEATREIVHRVKYAGRFEYLDRFRSEIESRFEPFYSSEPVVVPVPLHVRKLADRGFNQAEILANWVAKQQYLRLDLESLRKTRLTVSQATLTSRERQVNLRKSFQWRGANVPFSVLLVDDIYTTGATLQSCARVLRQAGVREVYAWTLFRTPSFAF